MPKSFSFTVTVLSVTYNIEGMVACSSRVLSTLRAMQFGKVAHNLLSMNNFLISSYCYILLTFKLNLMLHFQVFKLGLAKSIHHARVLIRQRHIR